MINFFDPTVIAAIVAALVSYLISRRSTYVNSVTTERTKWIGALRDNISQLSGQILTINQKQIFDSAFTISNPEFHRSAEEIHRLTSLIKLQLNPFNEIDKNILSILDDLEASLHEPYSHSWAGADYLLIAHAQWLLKAEWDKVRVEAAGPIRKPYLFYRMKRRAFQYRKFASSEGRVYHRDAANPLRIEPLRGTIYVDLTTLERVFQDGLDAGLHALDSCVPEISISPEILAAIRAGKFGRIGNLVSPSDLGPADFASK